MVSSELEKYDQEAKIDIYVKEYSSKKQDYIGECYEEIGKMVFERFLNNEDTDTLHFEITVYKD